MDFELSEEQKLIQDTAYKFALNEMEPVAKEYDREERFPKKIHQNSEDGDIGKHLLANWPTKF